MIEIPLTRGLVSLVENDDYEEYELLSLLSWRAKPSRNTFYAIADTKEGAKDRKVIRMHRLILGAPPGIQVDHENGNGLDNRRSNLRFATHAENMHNKPLSIRNTSGYKGVGWSQREGKWRSRLILGSRELHLGYFNDVVEAARAWDEAAMIHHGEFANLNFPA